MAKLSPKMQSVMDSLQNAEHYYSNPAKPFEHVKIHSKIEKDYRNAVHAWIYFDGMHGVRESTSTLKALEKRGLINIINAGGDSCDVIEVIGKVNPEPLTTVTQLKISRQCIDRPNWNPVELTEYMDSTITAEEVEAQLNDCQYFKWTVEVVGEVELTRWDYRKGVRS